MKNVSKKIWLQALAILNIENVNSAEELKNIYRLLCSKHHPDKGGNTEKMQQINWAYKYILENMDNQENSKKENLSEEASEILNKLILIPNINIDIVGCWIWVSGDTKPVKDELKTLGLKWHSKKIMWVYAGSKSVSRGNKSYDEICETYGKVSKKSQIPSQIR